MKASQWREASWNERSKPSAATWWKAGITPLSPSATNTPEKQWLKVTRFGITWATSKALTSEMKTSCWKKRTNLLEWLGIPVHQICPIKIQRLRRETVIQLRSNKRSEWLFGSKIQNAAMGWTNRLRERLFRSNPTWMKREICTGEYIRQNENQTPKAK